MQNLRTKDFLFQRGFQAESFWIIVYPNNPPRKRIANGMKQKLVMSLIESPRLTILRFVMCGNIISFFGFYGKPTTQCCSFRQLFKYNPFKSYSRNTIQRASEEPFSLVVYVVKRCGAKDGNIFYLIENGSIEGIGFFKGSIHQTYAFFSLSPGENPQRFMQKQQRVSPSKKIQGKKALGKLQISNYRNNP